MYAWGLLFSNYVKDEGHIEITLLYALLWKLIEDINCIL